MSSEAELCNMALSHIGVTNRIATLADNSTTGRECNLWYEHCRDLALRDAPWNFAKSIKSLAVVSGTPPPGWGYQYAYPADCLMIRAITTESGLRLPVNYLGTERYDESAYIPPTVPYEVQADPSTDGAKLIVCDIDTAYICYTKAVTVTNQFDVSYREMLTYLIAWKVGPGLRAKPDRVIDAKNNYFLTREHASAMTQNEKTPDREPESVSISGR